jgi:hypothetical protein
LFPNGRQTVLSEEILIQTFHYIPVEFGNGGPVSDDAILNWLHTQYHLIVLPDTLKYIIQTIDAFTGEAIDEHFRQFENSFLLR